MAVKCAICGEDRLLSCVDSKLSESQFFSDMVNYRCFQDPCIFTSIESENLHSICQVNFSEMDPFGRTVPCRIGKVGPEHSGLNCILTSAVFLILLLASLGLNSFLLLIYRKQRQAHLRLEAAIKQRKSRMELKIRQRLASNHEYEEVRLEEYNYYQSNPPNSASED